MSGKAATVQDAEVMLNSTRAARYIRREKSTLYNLVLNRAIVAGRARNGRSLLFRQSVLDQFLAERGEAPGRLEEA